MPAEILRAPVPVSGAVDGLLCRGVPVRVLRLTPEDEEAEPCDGERLRIGDEATLTDAGDEWIVVSGMTCDPCGPRWSQLHPADVAVNWSSPTALDIALRWLMDRGHDVAWMRPARYGGRVPAWDGLTEDEVAAIIVSVSVRGVAEGRGPICDLALPDALDWMARGLVDGGGAALIPGGVMVGVPDAR